MQETMYGEFIIKIMENLSKNGFPEKKVALPLEKLYESAADKGLSFNKVLEFLREKGIDHTKTTEKIIFFERKVEATQVESSAEPSFAMDDLMGMASGFMGGMNLNDMMMKAQEMLKNMSPEQKEAIQNMYQGMSEEEKQSILKKAKDMGLF
ncbi:MAG: hypothetical protein ACOH5I_06985 [Oligoflexus sp.]